MRCMRRACSTVEVADVRPASSAMVNAKRPVRPGASRVVGGDEQQAVLLGDDRPAGRPRAAVARRAGAAA